MSQSNHEQSNPRTAPTSPHPALEQPIRDVSPDDPFPVDDPGTSKPAQREK